jgi:hypothetical protein
MASKLVTISGAVEQVNGKGVKVQSEWLNVSQYRPITPMPAAGELVEAQVEQTDRGAWINSLKILGGTAPTATSALDRDRQIRRQVAIKTAAQLVGAFSQSHEEVKVEHVFPLADKILAWLEKGNEQPCGYRKEVISPTSDLSATGLATEVVPTPRSPIRTEPKGWKRNDATAV